MQSAISDNIISRGRSLASSVWGRLLFLGGTAAAAGFLAAFAAAAVFHLLTYKTATFREVCAQAEAVSPAFAAVLGGDENPDVAEAIAQGLSANPLVREAVIWNAQGRVLARYRRAEEEADAGESPRWEGPGHRFVLGQMVLQHPIEHRGRTAGMLRLRTGMLGLRSHLASSAAMGALILFGTVGGVLWVLLRARMEASASLRALAKNVGAAAGMERWDPAVRGGTDGQEDLQNLTEGVERLVRHVRGREEELRKTRTEMQRQVEERTSELSRINVRLKEEAEQLRRAEEANGNLAALVEHSHDFIGLIGLGGEFVFLNEAGRKMVGVGTAQEIRSVKLRDCFPDSYGQELQQEVLPGVISSGAWSGDANFRNLAAGKILAVHMSIFVVKQKQTGRPFCLAIMARDTSERLGLEAQLRQAQKMEAIGQLAAGVAHDFNNLLTVIQGYTTLLLSSRKLPPDANDALNQIFGAADRAATLTRQLLAFSRKQVLQIKDLDLNDVIANVNKMLNRVIGEHISVQFRYAPNLPLIRGDAGMMEQIILNLAVNARDAMPEGGSLNISTQELIIDKDYLPYHPEARTGRFVCLSIGDTGCGMSSEVMDHLFEPFFTTKDVGKGTGLGLATVYGIVKQHQGWIEASSKLGSGTVFTIFLPAHLGRSTEPARVKPARSESLKGSEAILLVEDEEALRELARQVLETHGYKIIEAGSAAEALVLWKMHGGGVRLLLTDMILPDGVTGRQLAEQLQGESKGLRVIYTSGYSPEAAGFDVRIIEGVNFLSKPYRPLALAQIVRNCLDGGD